MKGGIKVADPGHDYRSQDGKDRRSWIPGHVPITFVNSAKKEATVFSLGLCESLDISLRALERQPVDYSRRCVFSAVDRPLASRVTGKPASFHALHPPSSEIAFA